MSLSIVNQDGIPFEQDWLQAAWDLTGSSASGKTKMLFPHGENLQVWHMPILTAHDTPEWTTYAPGKGTISAYSTAVLFKLIEEAGVPTSHLGILNSENTLDRNLDMLPFEVIWRYINTKWSTYDKMHPWKVADGARFDELQLEIDMKWSVMVVWSDEPIHDPRIMVDEEGKPMLRGDGMPRLVKKTEGWWELEYLHFVRPNQKNVPVDTGDVRQAMWLLSQHLQTIYRHTRTIQKVTKDAYAEIGLANADGKVEFGIDKDGNLRLGDVLDLDSMRLLIPREVQFFDDKILSLTDPLWKAIAALIGEWRTIDEIRKILKWYHSSKQLFRDPKISGLLNDGERAAWVMKTSYIPTAEALSIRFGQEVGYWLQYDSSKPDVNPMGYVPSRSTHFTAPVRTKGDFDHMVSSFEALKTTMEVTDEAEIEQRIISFTVTSETPRQDDPHMSWAESIRNVTVDSNTRKTALFLLWLCDELGTDEFTVDNTILEYVLRYFGKAFCDKVQKPEETWHLNLKSLLTHWTRFKITRWS